MLKQLFEGPSKISFISNQFIYYFTLSIAFDWQSKLFEPLGFHFLIYKPMFLIVALLTIILRIEVKFNFTKLISNRNKVAARPTILPINSEDFIKLFYC